MYILVVVRHLVPKKIVCAGLMNPGDKYRFTRHNAGAMALDLLFPGASYTNARGLDAQVASAQYEGFEAELVKPQTYMNLSGQSIAKALKKYSTPAKYLIVLHDEVELGIGEVRHKFGGGHKGHNGLRSIMAILGHGDFHRIRIGVGRPKDDSGGIADYLLAFQPAHERAELAPLQKALAEAMQAINIA